MWSSVRVSENTDGGLVRASRSGHPGLQAKQKGIAKSKKPELPLPVSHAARRSRKAAERCARFGSLSASRAETETTIGFVGVAAKDADAPPKHRDETLASSRRWLRLRHCLSSSIAPSSRSKTRQVARKVISRRATANCSHDATSGLMKRILATGCVRSGVGATSRESARHNSRTTNTSSRSRCHWYSRTPHESPQATNTKRVSTPRRPLTTQAWETTTNVVGRNIINRAARLRLVASAARPFTARTAVRPLP